MSSDADSSTDGKPSISAFQFDIFCWILVEFSNFHWIFESRPLISKIQSKWQIPQFWVHFYYWNQRFDDFHGILEIGGLDSYRCLGTFLRSTFNKKQQIGKLRVEAFQRLKNQRLRTSPSKVMAISKFHNIPEMD